MNARIYKGYTLEEAKAELEHWKEAKRAAATGKSYKIGGRELDRYSLAEINGEIDKFAEIINVLSEQRVGPFKVRARQPRW